MARPPARRPAGPRFDDFRAGEVFESYRRTVTEADIATFTGLAGLRLPIFLDDEYARAHSPFGSRIAPGFLTAALSAGMIESVLGSDVIAGLAMDGFRFRSPVRIGDTLRAEIEIIEARPTSDGVRGVVTLAIRVLNQEDEVPLAYRASLMMHRRADPA